MTHFFSMAKHLSASQHWTCSSQGITWCLKSPKLSHPVSFSSWFSKWVTIYLEHPPAVFFFWCLRKKTRKKSHIFILLQNIICDFYHTTHAILTINYVLKIYFTQANISTYVNQMMCKGNTGVVSNNTIETKVRPLLKILAAQSSLPFQ